MMYDELKDDHAYESREEGCRSQKMATGRRCCLFAEKNSKTIGISLVFSIIINILLVGAAVIFLYVTQGGSGDSPLPPTPPPSPNSTNYTCPFALADGGGGSETPLAVTEIGTDFVSLCWKDLVLDKGAFLKGPYEIHISDFWTTANYTPTQAVSYSGRATSTTIRGLLPGLKHTIELRTSFSNGTISVNHLTDITTLSYGYCGNPSDMAAYQRTKTTMKPDIQSCMESHITSTDAAKACIQKP